MYKYQSSYNLFIYKSPSQKLVKSTSVQTCRDNKNKVKSELIYNKKRSQCFHLFNDRKFERNEWFSRMR